MVTTIKAESQLPPLQLINSAVDGDEIICTLRALWDETAIDEWEDGRHYHWRYKALTFAYAVPGGTPDIRAYLATNLSAIRAYVTTQVQAGNRMVQRVPQHIITEWKAADTVSELKAVLLKVFRHIMA